MPFTRQTPKTKSIYFINEKLCSTKSTHCRLNSESPMGGSFQAAKSSLHVQFSSSLSFLYPASSIPQLEISHAMTLQPGSAFDAAHTRMVCAQPGLQAVAAQQTEVLWGGHTVTLLSFQLLTTVRDNSYIPSPHQAKLTSDRDFWQRMKSRNFLRSCYML